MKKILLFLFGFCAGMTAQARDNSNMFDYIHDEDVHENIITNASKEHVYTPIVREGVQWVYSFKYHDESDPNTQKVIPMVFEFKGDTVINGIECKKLYRTYGGSGRDYGRRRGLNDNTVYEFDDQPMLVACCFENMKITKAYGTDREYLSSSDLWACFSEEYRNEMWYYDGTAELNFMTTDDADVKWYFVYNTYLDDMDYHFKNIYLLNRIRQSTKDLYFTYSINEFIDINGTQRFCYSSSSRNSYYIEGIGAFGFYGNNDMDGANFISPAAMYRTGGSTTSLSHIIENGQIVYKTSRFCEEIAKTANINDLSVPKVVDEHYYNLQGQRVDNPTPGIYIHGGKKVVVK